MALILFSDEEKLARKIIRRISNKAELGRRLGISRQLASYRVEEVYPTSIAELITVLDYAGFEIKEKEE